MGEYKPKSFNSTNTYLYYFFNTLKVIIGFIGIISLLTLLPIIINYLIGAENNFININGSIEGWHNFWSFYLNTIALILTGGVSVVLSLYLYRKKQSEIHSFNTREIIQQIINILQKSIDPISELLGFNLKIFISNVILNKDYPLVQKEIRESIDLLYSLLMKSEKLTRDINQYWITNKKKNIVTDSEIIYNILKGEREFKYYNYQDKSIGSFYPLSKTDLGNIFNPKHKSELLKIANYYKSIEKNYTEYLVARSNLLKTLTK